MSLPKNWKKLTAKKLVLDYQRQAFKNDNMEVVVKIGKEMARRLGVKGLKKVSPFGWVKYDRIISGLNNEVITEVRGGGFAVATRLEDVYDKLGRKRGTKVDFSAFESWLKGYG